MRTAARAAEEERRERTAARKRSVRRPSRTAPTFLLGDRAGQQTGVLARRRRTRIWLLIAFLVAVQVLVWLIRPDWPARLAALVVSILVTPLLAGLVLRRPH